jgi:hypothetical protein
MRATVPISGMLTWYSPRYSSRKGLKRLVGAVHFVDQQHRAGLGRLQGLQQRAADQVAGLIDLALHLLHAFTPLHSPHVQQLRGVVPFVQRLALLQPVVALQAQQLALQRLRQRLGQLGLAHAGLAFQQQGALQLERQEHGRGQAAVGKVAHALQRLLQGVMEVVGSLDGPGIHGAIAQVWTPDRVRGDSHCQASALATARWVITLMRLAR